MMRQLSRRSLGLAAGMLLLGGTATTLRAQPGSSPPTGPGPGRGPGMMGGGGMGGGMWTTPEYLDGLKSRLGITPAQEGAWKDYADTVSGAAETMRSMHETVWESMGTADWEERRSMMNGMFAARQQTQQTVQDAAKKLLPTLDKAQQDQAQGILPGLAGTCGGPRRMMGRRC